ncbi:MAG: DNA mismatch repair endonuclease MutL [Armatimonadetes bacterium]|nr:DNA mismatch repair endonuclease MutL [Armatimonadota bacterium]
MTEPRIKILPSEVVDRIAAGEVIERPASAVKELVENSLDAGATRIQVETEAGGKALLRVTDDGHGMTPEEAVLALERHATSKLYTAADLFNLRTLGFRGEALPSIAAVSEIEILTRTPEMPEGTRVRMAAGRLLAREAAPAPVGTCVTVRDLFYNVPARRRYLRSDQAEGAHVAEVVRRLALATCQVRFRLVQDGRETFLSPGGAEPLNTVVAALGRAAAREMLRLPEPQEGLLRVHGFTARPTRTASTRAAQLFYVNGRSVRSPLFYRALDDAYRGAVPQGRFPPAVVFLKLPPDAVDVNVHPSKLEVRFQDEGAVHGALLAALRAALAATASLHPAAVSPSPAGEGREGSAPARPVFGYPRPGRTKPALRETPPAVPAPPTAYPFASQAIVTPGRPGLPADAGVPHPGSRTLPDAERGAQPCGPYGRAPRDVDVSALHPPLPTPHSPGPPPALPHTPTPRASGPAPLGGLRLLGQARDLFLLAEADGELWIVDQHVAHERALFDRLMARADAEEGEEIQSLLLPTTLEMNAAAALALEEHREPLRFLGFDVQPFGPNTYRLCGVPRALVGRNYEQALRDLVDQLAELWEGPGKSGPLSRAQLATAAAGRACKTAVKAGQPLSPEEAEQLLADLRRSANPYTCPHGRPVFLTFSQAEIRRLFGEGECDRAGS